MSSESMAPAQRAALTRPTIVVAPWHRLALGAILVLSAILNFIELSRLGLGNTYYAAAVKSMLTSWHNFFFVSFDPGGFVTIDKPPLAFWIQAASAKLFGFNGVSLLLPEALAGVLSVAVLYYLVARWFGRTAGLAAALALAVTPVMIVVNRSNLIESILVLTVLLAAWAVSRATETGSVRWLLLGAFLLGLGFNEKTLEAYLVLPAFLLMYLLGAPVRWRIRFWHLGAAIVVLLVISLAWVTAVDPTPASQRPYVASSGTNSELSLALGYNGIGRLTGNTFSFLQGGTTLSNTLSDLTPTNLGFTVGEAGSASILRLINAELGGQTSWLLGLAILGFLAAAWRTRPRLPLDMRQSALVLWGGWLLTGGAFFSVAGFFHAYYLAMIAPAIAALAGIGIVAMWEDYRRPGWRGWLLPFALVAAAVVQVYILSAYPSWSSWLAPLVLASTIVAALGLIVLRLRPQINLDIRVAPVAVALAGIALLIAPFVWSEYTVANAAGNAVPSAGPQSRGGFGGFGGGRPRFGGGGFPFVPRGERGAGGFPFEFNGGRPPFGAPGGHGFGGRGGFGDQGTRANPQLVRYLEARQGSAKFLVGTFNAGAAEPFILTTGKPVMDLGGFMGGDHILSTLQLASDVAKGEVRYFLVSGGDRGGAGFGSGRFGEFFGRRGEGRGTVPGESRGGFPGGFPGVSRGFRGGFGGARDANSGLTTWITSHCSVVPASAYGAGSSGATLSITGASFGGQQLYDCGTQAREHSTS